MVKREKLGTTSVVMVAGTPKTEIEWVMKARATVSVVISGMGLLQANEYSNQHMSGDNDSLVMEGEDRQDQGEYGQKEHLELQMFQVAQ